MSLLYVFTNGRIFLSFLRSTNDFIAAVMASCRWAELCTTDILIDVYGFIAGGSNSPKRRRVYISGLTLSRIISSVIKPEIMS